MIGIFEQFHGATIVLGESTAGKSLRSSPQLGAGKHVQPQVNPFDLRPHLVHRFVELTLQAMESLHDDRESGYAYTQTANTGDRAYAGDQLQVIQRGLNVP